MCLWLCHTIAKLKCNMSMYASWLLKPIRVMSDILTRVNKCVVVKYTSKPKSRAEECPSEVRFARSASASSTWFPVRKRLTRIMEIASNGTSSRRLYDKCQTRWDDMHAWIHSFLWQEADIAEAFSHLNYRMLSSMVQSVVSKPSPAATATRRIWRCNICSKTARKYRLDGHVLKYHVPIDQAPYYCSICHFRCMEV